RVGVRKGMMFWGRERMAECCYETAVNELQKEHPDHGKVLWHLDCATNLNPQFTDAIKLKEEITGKQVTASPQSTVQRFVTEQILADKAAGLEFHNPPRIVPINPTTQHAATDMAPSTQPVVAISALATQPTTQPVVAVAPTTQPTTQPVEAEAVPPAVIEDESAVEAPSAAPATQPVQPNKPIRFTTIDLNDDDQ